MHEGLPKTLNEQLAALPPRPEMDKITCGLNHNIVSAMNTAGIPFILTEWRTKTRESMGWKDGPLPETLPFTDIHGVRIVLEEEHKRRLAQLLQVTVPTPDSFPWGLDTDRTIWGSQPKFDGSRLYYSATHVGLFLPNGARYAEVQLHSPEQYVAAEILRPAYDEFKRSAGENY